MAIDRKKIAVLHVAKQRLAIDDEAWRQLLQRTAGVESSRDLDAAGFDRVMTELKRLGFESDASKRNFGERRGMATDGQIALIRKLWAEYTDAQGTDASLGHWLFRTFRTSSIKFLDADRGSKAIDALKAMVARRSRETAHAAAPAPPAP